MPAYGLSSLRLFPLVPLAWTLACAPTPVPTEAPPSEPAAPSSAENSAPEGVSAKAAIDAAIAGDHRSADNRARDPERHPAETLGFFGLEPGMTVVELWPGGGWYTEILAATVKGEGKLVTTNFDTEASDDPKDYRVRVGKAFIEKIAGHEVYAGVEVVTVKDPKALVLAPEGSVDMVLTFRNSHNWISDGIAGDVYSAAFEALRPGGVLGVVQHRAKADDSRSPEELAKTGYLREDSLIASIEAAGFVLDEKSEVNANPRDTKDYDKGVWTLPPSYTLGDVDREKYAAIGESDRMTLRFRKPG